MHRLGWLVSSAFFLALTACPPPSAESQAKLATSDDVLVVEMTTNAAYGFGVDFVIPAAAPGDWVVFVATEAPTNLAPARTFDPDHHCQLKEADCMLAGVGAYAARATTDSAQKVTLHASVPTAAHGWAVLVRRGAAPAAQAEVDVTVDVTSDSGCDQPSKPDLRTNDVPSR